MSVTKQGDIMTSNKVDTYDNAVMLSAVDASVITGMDISEVRKAIKLAGLVVVAEVKTGKRGRPPKLYARGDLLAAIESARAVTGPALKVASAVAADISEVSDSTSDDFDTAVA